MTQPNALRGSGPNHRAGALRAGVASFVRGGDARKRRVAVMVPMSGSAGIWGPSCLSCAQLAIREINAGCGVGDREFDTV